MWKILKENWRSFLPAVGAVGMGVFFMMVPVLAAMLVSGLLFAFGLFYSNIVYRIHESRRSQPGPGFEGPCPPDFRNVTIRMYRSTPFYRDVN